VSTRGAAERTGGGPILLTALLALTCSCAAVRPPDLAARTSGRDPLLAVVTWNLHAGRGDLPRLVDDLTSGRLTGAPVHDYVILLQEAIQGGRHDVTEFARHRGLSAVFEPMWTTDRGASGIAIVASVPFETVRVVELPRVRRVRKAVIATIDTDGRRLFAAGTHFENRVEWLRGVLFFSEAARARQAAALVDALPEGPGFVGGDLNTWLGPDEGAARALRGRFEDTPRDAAEPTFRDRLVLDHLFFDLPEEWEAARDVVAERYGSDHNPVVGVILKRERL
jgi:endonuclease/exonuclease/phosphatase (EEP) superfamily protein YafD